MANDVFALKPKWTIHWQGSKMFLNFRLSPDVCNRKFRELVFELSAKFRSIDIMLSANFEQGTQTLKGDGENERSVFCPGMDSTFMGFGHHFGIETWRSLRHSERMGLDEKA